MFNVGDKIVYPMHGAGIVESIETKEILGAKQKYYVMKMPIGDIKVMVPTHNAQDVGIRGIIESKKSKAVLEVLTTGETEITANWNKRYRDNMEKIKSGDIFEVADVIRTLAFKQKSKGLSTGERKMFNSAKQILISELVLANEMEHTEVESMVNERIESTFKNLL